MFNLGLTEAEAIKSMSILLAVIVSMFVLDWWVSFCFRHVKQMDIPTRRKIIPFLAMVFIGPFVMLVYWLEE